MTSKHLKGQYLLIIIISVFLLSSCKFKRAEENRLQSITCDAERLNVRKKTFRSTTDNYHFRNTETRTSEQSHSGSYAVKLTKDQPYGFTIELENLKPDEYFHIEVWRYGGDNGILVADGLENKDYYYAQNKPGARDKDGWERIELDLHIPPVEEYKTLRIYTWNKGGDSVYFDDLKIIRASKRQYPVYDTPSLEFLISDKFMSQLEEKRKKAFQNGVLETEDNDYVKAKLVFNGDTLRASVRLKGDWLDHLEGPKWSFRVKMRKKDSWNGMTTFSIQTPLSRGFLDEWVTHIFFKKEDVLTTRYGFVPVKINGESLGIYAYEEHFDKHLVESNHRREGPILKYSEDLNWLVQRLYITDGIYYPAPVIEASEIVPFKLNSTIKNPVLKQSFIIGQNILQKYKEKDDFDVQGFDLDKMARFLAITDIMKADHALGWHNIRYYFNPVICKLEPVAFDCYTSGGTTNELAWNIFGENVLSDNFNERYRYLNKFFKNSEFVNQYISYLKKYSNSDYLLNFFKEIKNEIENNQKLLKQEFLYFQYDSSYIVEHTRLIRNKLGDYETNARAYLTEPPRAENNKVPNKTNENFNTEIPPYLIQVFSEQLSANSNKLTVKNFNSYTTELLGLGINKDSVERFENIHKLGAYGMKNTLSLEAPIDSKYLFFKIEGKQQVYSKEIFPWPPPVDFSPQQELFSKNNIEKDNPYILRGRQIIITAGNHVISKTVVIPEGYEVVFSPGATLDLNNNAGFISYSPVFLKGTTKLPVTLTSSDGRNMGFTVLLAAAKSELQHVKFDQLGTLDYKGWTLTGAVNFYESEVEMDYVEFKNNRCEDALNIIRSQFFMDNCSFDNIFADAFDSDFSKGTLSHSYFRDLGNDAIDFSGSEVTISDCNIVNPRDKGISGGENSHLKLRNIIIEKANIGMASKDQSVIEGSVIELSNCNYGIVAFRKKPEFGSAKVNLQHLKESGVSKTFLIEKGSELIIDNKIHNGTAKNVASLFYVQ